MRTMCSSAPTHNHSVKGTSCGIDGGGLTPWLNICHFGASPPRSYATRTLLFVAGAAPSGYCTGSWLQTEGGSTNRVSACPMRCLD